MVEPVSNSIKRLLQQASQPDDKKNARSKKSTLLNKATDDIERIMNNGTPLEKAAVIIKSVFTLGLYLFFSHKASKDEENTLLRNAGNIVAALCQLTENPDEEAIFEYDKQLFSMGKSYDADNKIILTDQGNDQVTEVDCDTEVALKNISEELYNKEISHDYRNQLASAIANTRTVDVQHEVIEAAKGLVNINNHYDIIQMCNLLKKITEAQGEPTALQPAGINQIIFNFALRNPKSFASFLQENDKDPGNLLENGVLVPSKIQDSFGKARMFFIKQMLPTDDEKTLKNRETILIKALPHLEMMSDRAGDSDLSPALNTFAVEAGALRTAVGYMLTPAHLRDAD